MPKYFLLCLLATGFFSRVPLVNAQSRLAGEISPLEAQTQSEVDNLLISQDKPIVVPSGSGETISEIQVRFVDKQGNPTEGKTKPDIITREFALQPGDVYDAELAQTGLRGVNRLFIIDQATLDLEPTGDSDSVVMVVQVKENSQFFFSFGLTLDPPTALNGPARPTTVIPMSDRAGGLSSGVRLGLLNLGGNNQALTLGIEGGEELFGLDLDYRKFIKHDKGYAVNFFNRQGVEPEFDGGDRDVNLDNGDDPWIGRIGGGFEVFNSIAKDFQGALGINYQLVSARDDAFSSGLEPVDEFGNQITFSDDGQDILLTLNFATSLDKRNRRSNPTQGYRLLFQTDQSIPVGDSSIFHNRLAANYTQYLPVPLFGFREGAKTLVLNFQGGTVIGDLPPYEAFSLGGSSSVRGYGSGELGTGRSFVQTTAEYRFPIFAMSAFKKEFDIGGTLFIDYATDLGSGDTVKGEPAEVRDKPGDGFGYGVGLRTLTPIGIIRLDFGINDQGDTAVIFNIGERF
ncbi:outer membrane protein/protective antigen OMA87 [Xenococcus sp. PCC 7305]|uniref:BamA/TamA family outer membrane protein n=1 Tax=Xenococcus sp. PCC 7305 TaxID=102125 RepID=UPI0002ACEE81|nr:BamA/TamA family outer membrane protein [Xenococcus sp. PCC 7305]ELS04394.1 outer membrane protein/protective antigen OMA87 [Xenococcus sp. PCC 7305]